MQMLNTLRMAAGEDCMTGPPINLLVQHVQKDMEKRYALCKCGEASAAIVLWQLLTVVSMVFATTDDSSA